MSDLRTTFAALGVSLALTAATTGGLVLLSGSGAESTATAAPAPTAVAWSETPAYEALSAVLASPSPDWFGQGEASFAAAPPYPTSCLADLAAPAVSGSRSYLVADVPLRLTVSAYGAGAGASEYASVLDAVDGCGGVSIAEPLALGVESTALDASSATTPRTVVQWRRGDVVAYLSGPATTDVRSAAAVADAALDAALATSCLDQASDTDASTRSPWLDRAAFRGLRVSEDVLVPAPAEPVPPLGVSAVPVPSPDVAAPSVTRPRTPSYPVWPPLPAVREAPDAPAVPLAPETVATIEVRVDDTTGPGCGWLFAGTSAPAYDEEAEEATATAARESARASLEASGRAWSDGVLGYYSEYASYLTESAEYTAYASEVASVSAAWDVIAREWSAYRTAKANYDAAVSAAASFESRRATAESTYAAGLAACAAAPVTETYTVTPTPTTTPSSSSTTPSSTPSSTSSPSPSSASPTATPTTAPSPTTATRVVPPPACPTRPSILDESAPAVPTAPTAPADPRPADAR